MKTQDLLNALTTVKPGLSNKEIIEQSTNFAFIDGHVVTYNDEISISAPLEEIDFEGAIKADELYKFLNKVDAKEISLKKEKDKILIKAGRSRVSLKINEVKLDLSEINGKKKWKPLAEDFLPAINFVAFAASKDASTPIFTCASVSSGTVSATDRYRIAKHDSSIDQNFFLPVDTLGVLNNINPTKICLQKQWVHFKNENDVVLSSRLVISDQYPDIDQFFEEQSGEEIQFPEKLKKVVDRACVFSASEFAYDRMLIVTIKNGKITIKTESEYAKFIESTKIDFEGEPLAFKILAESFQQILEKGLTAYFQKNKILFEGEGWQYLTLTTLLEE